MLAAVSALLLLGLAPAPASAGDDTVRAEAYFHAITGGDAEIIASFYADDAEFRWIGGPLAGLYKGRDSIKGVWARFTEAAGAFTHEVLELKETGKGKTSVVTARVAFKGATEVPVKFLMTYKDGKITSETWQVDRSPNATARAETAPSAPAAAPVPQAPAPVAAVAPAPAVSVNVVTAPVVPEVKPVPVAKVELKPAPVEAKPVTAATVAVVEPSTTNNAAAGAQEPAEELPDYLPRGAKPAVAAPKAAAAPAEARPAPAAPRAKSAEKKRKKQRTYEYEDDDYDMGYGYGYEFRRPWRGYNDYYGWRSYGGYRGYGGPWGGYGRYGGGYGY